MGTREFAAGTADDRLDSQLLLRSTEDAAAFGEFYERHVRAVVTYFARRTACAHTAGDLSAETFAEALRTVHRYRADRGAPRAWLFGIANNQLRGFLRTASTSDRALRRLGIDHRPSDQSQFVAEQVDLERLRPAVKAGISELSASVRDAVILRVVDGLPYKDVAAILGCSEGAARVRVTRGLTQLGSDQELAAQWTTLSSVQPRTTS